MNTPQNDAVIRNEQSIKVSSLTLDKDELHSFCRLLQERSEAAGKLEVANYQKGDLTDDQYQLNIQTLHEGFTIRVTIAGKNGEHLWGTVEEVFSSPNFPEEVKSLYVDSGSPLKATHNYYIRNGFIIFFDFNKPKILDFTFLPSQETPNESSIKVTGYDATWVNGVFAELKKFIDSRSSSLSKVHGHSIYDVLLWFLGFPIGFWACYRLSPLIESSFASYSTFVINALYLYVFVACLFLFRFLFHYLRWVCPLVEYRGKHSKVVAHRLLLSAIAASVIGSFVYDLVKLMKP
jgi:hypothetical protein